MARIRTIKPDFWEDETIGALSIEARLLFIASWNLADDEGRLRWSPELLKAQVFSYDAQVEAADVERFMAELAANELVVAYVGGKVAQRLAYIVNFHKHQRINRPQPAKFAAPSDVNDSVNGSVSGSVNDSVNGSVNDSVNDSPQAGDESVSEPFTAGREGKGREGSGVSAPAPAEPVAPSADAEDGTTTRELCKYLAEKVSEHRGTPLPKWDLKAWREPMSLLLRRGPANWARPAPVPPERVTGAINYTFRELAAPTSPRAFCWADQIRSAAALRDHWDDLLAAGRQKRKTGEAPTPDLSKWGAGNFGTEASE